MENDPTVILEEDYLEKRRKQAEAGDVRQLSGMLTIDGAEFQWHARAVDKSWFVSVVNGSFGRRGRITEDDPVDFALRLAKEVAAAVDR